MSLIKISYRTNYLHTYFKTTAVIPDTNKTDYTTVWLLHGYTGDDSAWSRHINVEQLAREHDWAIIMPEARNAFYTDSDFIPYYSYFVDEYIPKMQSLLPISKEWTRNYIVGSSMGGYGALKIGFQNPNTFSKVAALSPITDIKHFRDNPQCPMDNKTFDTIFDSPEKIRDNQLISIFDKVHPKQRVLTLCGDKDYMYEDNVMFKSFLQTQLKDNYTWMQVDGDHSWNTWTKNIGKVFDWFE